MEILPGFYIVQGWKSRTELYTEGAKINVLPVQSDMTQGRQWLRPGDTADVIAPARIVDNPSGQRFGYGALTLEWPLVNLSPKMVRYIQSTYFPASGSDTFFKRTMSNKLTIQTFNRGSGEWEAYHTFARFADLANEAAPLLGGYNDLKITFTAKGEAPDGPDIEPVATGESADATEGLVWSFDVVINNVGDTVTFGDTVTTVVLPASMTYNDVFLSDFMTITYSTNGTSYSGTLPDVDDITHVRITSTALIAAGNSSDIFTLYFIPNTVVDDQVFTVTSVTEQDTDSTNNSATVGVDIKAFTPSYYNTMRLWLDAQAFVYHDIGATDLATEGETVDHWRDTSGFVAHATQNTGGNRPVYRTAQANGLSALEFDGIDDYFLINSAQFGSFGADITLFVVYDPVNDSGTPGPETLFTDDLRRLDFAHKVDNLLDDTTGVYLNSGATVVPFDAAQGGLQVLTFRVDGGSFIELYRDQSLIAQTAVAQTGVLAGGIVGAYYGGAVYGAFYKGLIYEIIAYSTPLVEEGVAAVQSYLMTKYGV